MASESQSELTEADIPGASLKGRVPEALKISELKFWLRCRHGGASGLTKLKTKSDYVQRFVFTTHVCNVYKHVVVIYNLWSCPVQAFVVGCTTNQFTGSVVVYSYS